MASTTPPLVTGTGSTSPSPLTIGLVLLLALWPLVSVYRGIGRALAKDYASLGVRGVCVVGRRADAVKVVVGDCEALVGNTAKGKKGKKSRKGNADGEKGMDILGWGGIDTVIVAAGVSALRQLMEVAGVEPSKDNKAAIPDASAEGIQRAVDVAALATRELSSLPPQSCSLASVIPAPTRALYASTKAASLLLYEALAIEHPRIAFTLFMPSTVERDFRLGAMDGGAPHETDLDVHGLKKDDVSKRCPDAVERDEKNVFMPWAMGWPTFVEGPARVKYNLPKRDSTDNLIEHDAPVSRPDFGFGNQIKLRSPRLRTPTPGKYYYYYPVSVGKMRRASLAQPTRTSPTPAKSSSSSALYLSILGDPLTGIVPTKRCTAPLYYNSPRLDLTWPFCRYVSEHLPRGAPPYCGRAENAHVATKLLLNTSSRSRV
ncbi:hypothetical protein C8J57DRAFT_1509813 [Mycena rebaudengoi]|nr:hypothetical protein C8J57DRAFT_1509813 [Mycena rebaudengoi]